MKKIVLISDNHYNLNVVKKIYFANQDADYYLHCGDSELKPEDLFPFASVRGNNDYGFDFPLQKHLNIEGNDILMLHGHRYVAALYYDMLLRKAKEENAKVVFFGHTHAFCNQIIDGVHLINPGSCNHNRDGSEPTYAIVTIDGNNINVEKKLVSEVEVI